MKKALSGFTLSELLVSLSVLGLIAAFAVPKVLTSVGASTLSAIGKESVATVSQAYDAVKVQNNGFVATNVQGGMLAATLNYATRGSTYQGNPAVASPGLISGTCPAINTTTGRYDSGACYHKLQSGAILAVNYGDTFADGGTAGREGKIVFWLDPDASGTAAPMALAIGVDGRLMAGGNAFVTTAGSPFDYGAGGAQHILTSQTTDLGAGGPAIGADTRANNETATAATANETAGTAWFRW